MKFAVGDAVRIIPNDELRKFAEARDNFGEILYIQEIHDGQVYVEDLDDFYFIESELELAEEIPEIVIEDFIKIIS